MRKRRFSLKPFIFEIIAFVIAALFLVQLFNIDFARRLITSFEYFRPEFTFTFFVVFAVLTAVLGLMLYLQVRKKKLKSTSRLSPFAKTVVRSHKVREMSQTQIAYTAQLGIVHEKIDMPVDIDAANPRVVELYFEYEGKLEI